MNKTKNNNTLKVLIDKDKGGSKFLIIDKKGDKTILLDRNHAFDILLKMDCLNRDVLEIGYEIINTNEILSIYTI